MKTTRKEAIAVGDRYYKTETPCIHGHNSKRATEDGSCLECRLERQRKSRAMLRDEIKMLEAR